MTEVVLIDIDVKFKYMERYHLFDILQKKIEFCTKLLDVQIEDMNIRKSQCGNVHLHLITSDMSPQQFIQLKYCIGEDHKRLNFSIYRFEQMGEFLDFFNMKRTKKKCK